MLSWPPAVRDAHELTHQIRWLTAASPSTLHFSAVLGSTPTDGLSSFIWVFKQQRPSYWAVTSCHICPLKYQLGFHLLCLKTCISYCLWHGHLCKVFQHLISAFPCTELPRSSTGISQCCHRDFSPLPVWCRKLPGLLAKLSLAKPSEK